MHHWFAVRSCQSCTVFVFCMHDSTRDCTVAQTLESKRSPGSVFGHSFHDLWKNGRSVKTSNTPRWCFLGYLRRCLDILAPRLANKGARCSSWAKKLDFWRPGGGGGRATRVAAPDLGYPPLRNTKGTAGAPPGGFGYQLKKLRLRLRLPT